MRIFHATAVSTLLLSACVNPEFMATVDGFADTTASAVATQNQRLASIDAHVREDLASNRVKLVQSGGCALLGIPGSDPRACVIQRRDGKEIPHTRAYRNIAALNKGVVGYASSLKTLASDQAEDVAAHSAALANLSGALNQLRDDIAGMEQRDPASASANASANADANAGPGTGLVVLQELTALYFDHQRTKALKRIIIAANPVFQDAMRLMSANNEVIGSTKAAYYVDILDETKKDLANAVNRRAPREVIGKLQDRMFQTAAAARSSAAFKDIFPKIAAAHAELAKSAASQADRAALNAAINKISDAVKTIQAAK